jgi:hypothetical protein
MTHIEGHIPNAEDDGSAFSPVIKMFGHITLKDHPHFKILFLNNNRVDLEPNAKVGFHLILVPYDHLVTDLFKEKKYCAIAFDLENYSDHEEAENEANRFIEKKLGVVFKEPGKPDHSKIVPIEKLGVELVDEASKTGKPTHQRILSQSCAYMKTNWCKLVYSTGDPITWITENVVNLDDMEKSILGCGNPKTGNTDKGISIQEVFIKANLKW